MAHCDLQQQQRLATRQGDQRRSLGRLQKTQLNVLPQCSAHHGVPQHFLLQSGVSIGLNISTSAMA
eukprot:1639705-Rhodomonas_salina.1